MAEVACLACAGEQGATHTCGDSGTYLAAEAHATGEVEELAAAWPTWDARIGLRLRALDEGAARGHLADLMGALLDDALVESLDFTLTTVVPA